MSKFYFVKIFRYIFIFFPYHFHLNIHLQFGSSTLVKNKWVINLLKPHLLLDTYLGCRPGILNIHNHGLRTPSEEIAFTARPKIHSQSQIFGYGWSIFCLPHRPKFSDFFDLCLHWVSVVRDVDANANFHSYMTWQKQWIYIYVQQRIAYKKMCPETPTSITTYIVDEFI